MRFDNQFSDATNGTSFHRVTIRTTINKLRAIAEPICFNNDGEDKVNVEWAGVTSEGYPFTIYDWKEYRILDEDEKIEFHIGAHSRYNSVVAKDELLKLLSK